MWAMKPEIDSRDKAIMRVVRDLRPPSQKYLAENLHISYSTLRGRVVSLRLAGYLAAEDRKHSVFLELTEKGHEALRTEGVQKA